MDLSRVSRLPQGIRDVAAPGPGHPSVSRDGRQCCGAAGQRKSLALLALLAAAGRRGQSRDKILAWLWPEIPIDKATHRLAQLIYSLRRDLAADDLFLGSTDLRLNPAVLTTDLAEYSAALETGDLPRAVAAYGGPFLDGFYLSDAPDFEHWLEEERVRLAERHSAALEALARDAATRGDVVAAAGRWRQLAQAEPLNARLAVCYMGALCAAGDRPSALRFAQAYETLLRQEFDMEPDPAVTAAAERLKSRPAGSAGVDTPPAPAIAVLAFANLTPEGENDYFSHGLTEELTSALARVPRLRVASRTSVTALEKKGLDARELAERLGVSALVEGSVRKVGNRVRVSAQLVNPADGCPLWSETYERTLDDVFALQEELSRAIAGAVLGAAGQTPDPLVRRPTTMVDAYTLYLRGRYSAHKRTLEGLRLAIEYLEQAVELDSSFALGYAGLAESWAILGFTPEFGTSPVPEAASRARAAALEALRLDPRLAQARTWLGVVHFLYDWDWTAAEAEFRRAIQLNPGYALAETWYAIFLGAMGRHEESLPRILHAEAIEPLSLQIRLCVGRCYYWARRYEQAHRALVGLLADEPGHPLTTIWLARTLCGLGRQVEAIEALEGLPSNQQTPYVRSVMANALAGGGRLDEARAMCARLERDVHEGLAGAIATIGARGLLGEHDVALDLLEAAVHRRDPFLPWVRSDPIYDPIRAHPRFRNLLSEFGFAPAAPADAALAAAPAPSATQGG
jgi:serine/threonine-protein kinase